MKLYVTHVSAKMFLLMLEKSIYLYERPVFFHYFLPRSSYTNLFFALIGCYGC